MTRPPPHSAAAGLKSVRALPRTIWALGLGSMFMDTSSELVHSLLPIFMASVLGASMAAIGFVEGVAEATAAITKIFSGALSDYLGKRKLLLVLGYGLGAITKPMFPLATSLAWVFSGRFIDRIGKGIRGAPRDALVADITAPEQRGAAYGLRQSLDSIGALAGPLLAVGLMTWFANQIRMVLWVAVLPALIAVGLFMIAVREPEHTHRASAPAATRDLSFAKRLPLRYWLIVLLGAVFTLARFSEAFLVLRAQNVGLAIGYVPTVMVVMNVVYATAAYPAGIAADILSQRMLLLVGLAVLAAADLVLASIIAGALWSAIGAPAPFIAGAAFAAVAAGGLLVYRPRNRNGT